MLVLSIKFTKQYILVIVNTPQSYSFLWFMQVPCSSLNYILLSFESSILSWRSKAFLCIVSLLVQKLIMFFSKKGTDLYRSLHESRKVILRLARSTTISIQWCTSTNNQGIRIHLIFKSFRLVISFCIR